MASLLRSLYAGLAGALALTAIHETVRRLRPEDAPRMDLLGMRALTQGFRAAGASPPPAPELYRLTLAADVVSNALYFALAGTGKAAPRRGLLLGVAAGAGGVLLPGPLGLGEAPSNRTPQTQAMTVAWYTIGGLVAGAAGRWLRKKKPAKHRPAAAPDEVWATTASF